MILKSTFKAWTTWSDFQNAERQELFCTKSYRHNIRKRIEQWTRCAILTISGFKQTAWILLNKWVWQFFSFHLILFSSNWQSSFIHRQKNVQFYYLAKTDLSLKLSVASSKLLKFYSSIDFEFFPFITWGSQTCFLVFRKDLISDF